MLMMPLVAAGLGQYDRGSPELLSSIHTWLMGFIFKDAHF